jgi:hypothetical protein
MMLAKLPVLALVAALLAACASVDQIETSDPATLRPFKTFHVQQIQFTFATDITDEQRERVSTELRTAVVAALNQRGYREAAQADVLVTLGALSRPTLPEAESAQSPLHAVDTSVLDSSRPPSAPSSQTAPPGVGREGDLVLELLDPQTQRSIWHASSTGAATTPSEALRKARATYAAMVARLPMAAH